MFSETHVAFFLLPFLAFIPWNPVLYHIYTIVYFCSYFLLFKHLGILLVSVCEHFILFPYVVFINIFMIVETFLISDDEGIERDNETNKNNPSKDIEEIPGLRNRFTASRFDY